MRFPTPFAQDGLDLGLHVGGDDEGVPVGHATAAASSDPAGVCEVFDVGYDCTPCETAAIGDTQEAWSSTTTVLVRPTRQRQSDESGNGGKIGYPNADPPAGSEAESA